MLLGADRIGGNRDHLLQPGALHDGVTLLHHTLVADRHGLHLLDGVLDVSVRTLGRLRALPGGWYWSPQGGSQLHFDAGPGGAPVGIRIAQSDGDTVRFAFAAATAWSPTPDQMKTFEGRYTSNDLGVTFDVRLRNDSLTVSSLPGRFMTLRPTYPDAFEARGAAVWFTRDRRGRVTAAHFGESRLWDLELTRGR